MCIYILVFEAEGGWSRGHGAAQGRDVAWGWECVVVPPAACGWGRRATVALVTKGGQAPGGAPGMPFAAENMWASGAA